MEETFYTQRLNRLENTSAGDDKQATVDKNAQPVFQRKENGLRFKKTLAKENLRKRGSLIANETMMDKYSNKKQNVDKTNVKSLYIYS